jgi:serine/threonine protein kinase
VWNDIHFIEMEFVDGGSVWDLMGNGAQAIDLGTAAPLMLQMLEGLAYAHEVPIVVTTAQGNRTQIGVIHRDLKPPNVMLAHQDGGLVAKLTDFGLAKAFGAAGCTQGSLSQTGMACGSPPYMALEHLVNYRYVKPATDVFEMAATFFHMLTGQTVREFGGGRDPFSCVLEAPLRHLKDYMDHCPKELGKVMDRALAVEPDDRYTNGRQFLEAMRRAL